MNIHPELVAGLKWGSHLPSLVWSLVASCGPVLEVGVGHFSTPFLHSWSQAAKREIISLEADAEWGEPFRRKYLTPLHRFDLRAYELSVPAVIEERKIEEAKDGITIGSTFGVAFLDHSPGVRRVEDFKLLAPHTAYLVVHDYQDEIEEGIAPLLESGFEYRIFNDYLPRTLIASLKYAAY